jgi:hypothetical protein
MKKKYFLVSDFRRSVLMVSAAACLGLTGCSSSNEGDWDSGNSDAKQGVITEMSEAENGEWKVTDERFSQDGRRMAILHHLDGKTDTLQGEALERGLQQQAQVQQHHTSGMGGMNMLFTALMFSRMGSMMGYSAGPNPRVYSNPGVYERSSTMYRQSAPRTGRTGFFRNSGRSGGGFMG